ncbi:MAG: 23S rRNA (uracil(1939)-C(5))-methyltransferase RlmD [Candidatus Omnitrophica bacterium]|nr:23S rRNA (uracil(1939)-C(5))-methyltransferase RlmD [Candidatus Omnitrophota bacterium]
MNETVLVISTLSTQGEGIARVEGKAVFTPFTLPGEVWRVRISDRKKNYDRAFPIEMIERGDDSPERIMPACPYFGSCGGCQLQHMPYESQLEWKRLWLQDTFRRVGHIQIEANPAVSSPPWEYRNKITLSLRIVQGKIVFAFHHVQQPNRPVAVNDCPIAHPLIRQCMPFVIQALNQSRPRLRQAERGRSQGSRVQFHAAGGKISLVFFDAVFSSSAADALSDKIFQADVPISEIVLGEASGDKVRSVSYYPDQELIDSNAGSAFFQVNDAIRERLYQYILDLPFRKKKSALDGYCGAGLLTRRLAERFEHITGVESNSSAVEEALGQIEMNHSEDDITFVNQTMEDFFEQNNESFDVVILNPPRAGLSETVRRQLLQKMPPEMAVISCHPAALARDLRVLTGQGYEIQSVQPFDMFPQTYHLETVVHVIHP